LLKRIRVFFGCPGSINAQQEDPTWDFNGDFRARAEFNDLASNTGRHCQRLRFRFGANFIVADSLSLGARLRTDSGDQNNPDYDIGNNADNIIF
jgi:hypothetical protein